MPADDRTAVRTLPDYLTTAIKASLPALLPEGFASLALGAVFAEAVTSRLPALAANRINKYIHELDARLQSHDRQLLELRFQQSPVLDIFHEGARQATRASADERIGHIAGAVRSFVTRDQVKEEFSMTILRLLEQVTNSEIVMLRAFAIDGWTDRQPFMAARPEVFFDPHKGMNALTDADREDRSMFRARIAQLERLGLAGPRGTYQVVSNLGAILLNSIGYEAKGHGTAQELRAAHTASGQLAAARSVR